MSKAKLSRMEVVTTVTLPELSRMEVVTIVSYLLELSTMKVATIVTC